MTPWSQKAGQLIAEDLAAELGIAVPQNAWIAFAVQAERECAGGTSVGAQHNNPLNLTTGGGRYTYPGQTGTYGGGDASEQHNDFASFATLEDGCRACAGNYAAPTYAGVQDAFRGGDPVAIAEAISASPWDSGHYGGTLADEVRADLAMLQEVQDVTEEQVRAIALQVVTDFIANTYGPALEKEIVDRIGSAESSTIAQAVPAALRAVAARLSTPATPATPSSS